MADLVKKGALLLAIALLSSCLTVRAEIELDDSLSGTMAYSASISTLAADLEQVDRSKSIIPFPLLAGDFDRALGKSEGLEVLARRFSDDETRYYADNRIAFGSLEDLSAFSGISFASRIEGNNRRLDILLYENSGEGVAGSPVPGVVRDSFPDEYIEIKIVIPGDIISVEGATFSGDSVTFRISISELIESSGNVQFSVEYR